MKKGGLLLFLILAPAVFAESYYSGWSHSCEGTKLNAGKITIYPQLDPSNFDKLLISYNGTVNGSLFVLRNDCQLQNKLKFCYLNRILETENNSDKFCIDWSTHTLMPDIDLAVSSSEPILSITRKVSSTKIMAGDEFYVSVKITNTGGEKVENAFYNEEISPAFAFISTTRGNFDGSNILKGYSDIDPGEILEFKYVLRALSNLSAHKTTGTLSYYYGGKKNASSSISIPINDYLTDSIIAPSKMAVGEEKEVSIKLTAKEDLPLLRDVTYKLIVRGFNITDIDPNFIKKGSDYMANINIPAGKTQEYFFSINSKENNPGNITLIHSYTINDVDVISAVSKKIAMEYLLPNLTIITVPNGTQFFSNVPLRYSALFENRNKDTLFKNINCYVQDNASLTNQSAINEGLLYGSWLVNQQSIELPWVFNQTKYLIKMNCSYMLSSGQKYYAATSKKIEALPRKIMPELGIIQTIQTTAEPGSTIPIRIKAYSKNGKSLTNIQVADQHVGTLLKSGKSSLTLDSSSGEFGYDYELYLPKDIGNFTTIITTADYYYEGTFQRVTKKSSINLTKKKVSEFEDDINPPTTIPQNVGNKKQNTTSTLVTTSLSTVITTTTIPANPNLGQRLMTNLEVFINSLFPKKLK